MKAFKVELLIIDFDEVGAEGIKAQLENTKYANRCISPEVMKVTEKDLGEWGDDHPLNSRNTASAEFERLFKE